MQEILLFNKFRSIKMSELEIELEVESKMATKMFLLGRLFYDYSEKKA